jgi:hypothetical protein
MVRYAFGCRVIAVCSIAAWRNFSSAVQTAIRAEVDAQPQLPNPCRLERSCRNGQRRWANGTIDSFRSYQQSRSSHRLKAL